VEPFFYFASLMLLLTITLNASSMLSIVICTKNPQINPDLEKNIHKTIGIDYEIITIDNSKNEYSIFSAYNSGISKSKFPYICFVHDDVLFMTENWGMHICNHLIDSSVGIIGVAGGDLMTKVPAPWSVSGIAKNFIQSDKSQKRKSVNHTAQKNQGSIIQEVVLLDGVLLCMSRILLEKIRFDDKTFDGFHAYDIDICIQVKLAGYKNFVVYDIAIEHFSHGFRNKEWVMNMLKVFTKWKPFLPISSNNYSLEEIEKIEKKSLFVFVKRMVHLKFTGSEIFNAVSELWEQIFPERSLNALARQVKVMEILSYFSILGLKTHF
jgi:hypothetical protein